ESHFGQSIASADLNSDGFSDVIVGAPGAALFDEIGLCALPEGASSPPGVAYVFYGPLSGQVMASMADASLSGVNGWDRFGSSVSGAGDVNGDGAADLLVGGAQMGTGAVNSGGAFVAFGPFGGPASYFESAGVVMLGELSSDAAGTSVTHSFRIGETT
nr:FG-GAP repeat protein [bacterium]